MRGAAAGDSAGTRGAGSPPDGVHIAVVDDRQATRRLVAAQAASTPGIGEVTVSEGANGRHAVLLRFTARPPDVLVVNGRMPLGDGLFAIEHIRYRERARGLPRVPIVIGSTRPPALERALLAGADAAIPYPPTRHWTWAVVRWLLGHPTPAAPVGDAGPEPDPVVGAFDAVRAGLPAGIPVRGLMTWFFAANPLLDGARPIDLFADPDALVAAARAEADAETDVDSD
jgi:CheY-like chemotaxis protein